MNVGERIKRRREKVKISAEQLADFLNVSKTTVYRYEKGEIEKLPVDKLKSIADYLNTTPAHLMGWDEDFYSVKNAVSGLNDENIKKVIDFAKELHKKQSRKPKQMTVLYIDGYVSAGSGFFQDDHLDAEISIPTEEVPDKYDLVAKVIGESMAPKINDGDLVFIKHTPEVENGALGVFQVNGENYIKQLKKDPQGPYLKSLNRNYDDVMLSEADDIRTLGEVVEIYKER